MSDEREILTWDLFGEATRDLAQRITDDYEPDMILSIARGGLLPYVKARLDAEGAA